MTLLVPTLMFVMGWNDFWTSKVLLHVYYIIVHRGLKLDGAIGQGEICNSLKIKFFQNPSCPILEKIK